MNISPSFFTLADLKLETYQTFHFLTLKKVPLFVFITLRASSVLYYLLSTGIHKRCTSSSQAHCVFFNHFLLLLSSTANSPGSQVSGAPSCILVNEACNLHFSCLHFLPRVTCAALLCSSLHTASRAGALGGSLVLSACLNHSFQALPKYSLGAVCNTAHWPNTISGGHIHTNILSVSTTRLCHAGKVFLKQRWVNLDLKEFSDKYFSVNILRHLKTDVFSKLAQRL